VLPILLGLTVRQWDSLIGTYPEIEPYLLYAKMKDPSTPKSAYARLLKRICKDNRTACRLACEYAADKRSSAVKIPPCPETYTVLSFLYKKTNKIDYLIKIARKFPKSREAKQVLNMSISPVLKLMVLYRNGRYKEVLKLADTSDPRQRSYYLLAKWKVSGITYDQILQLPPKFRKGPLIDALVRYLNAENYDSIRLALLELIKLGDYERAYRVMSSEVAKPFLRYEGSDLYVRLRSTADPDILSASALVWLGLGAYGVHYLEDAYGWFSKAREKARKGSFAWTQATFWLYRITGRKEHLEDLKRYNPISYYSLELGLRPVWNDSAWDTLGSLRNYRIGKILEEIAGWFVAVEWYLKDVPSAYRRAKELHREGNFLRLSYFLAALYSRMPKERGIPRWWAEMSFPLSIYRREIDSAAREFGVDPLLLRAIVREESRFRSKARSRVGAIGLAQVMPFNFKRFREIFGERIRNRYDPLTNLRVGAWLLSLAMEEYVSPHLSAAAYNAGHAALNRWLCDYGYELLDFYLFVDIIPYNETRNYVRRVMRTYHMYRFLLDSPFGSNLEWAP